MKLFIKYLSSSPVEKCSIFWREKQSAISETVKLRACVLRIDLKFEIGLSPRMHQTPNRYISNGSLPVTLGAKTAWYKHGFFIHLHPSYSSSRNYQQ